MTTNVDVDPFQVVIERDVGLFFSPFRFLLAGSIVACLCPDSDGEFGPSGIVKTLCIFG